MTASVPDLLLDLPGGPLAIALAAGEETLAQPLRERWRELLLEPAGAGGAGGAGGAAGGDGAAEAEVLRPGRLLLRGSGDLDIRRATYDLSGQVTRRLLARFVGSALLLHSGALEHPRLGRLLLIGPSGAGKSTAVSVLAREGAYLSDELALLDPETFAITGYPKPVSRAAEGGGKQDLALRDLGLRAVRAAAAPDLVVLLSRRSAEHDASASARAVRLPLLEAITRIAAQSSLLWRIPDPLGVLARLLDTVGGALDVTYREAADLEAALAAAPPPAQEEWLTLEPNAGARRAEAGEHEVEDFVQAILTADGLVVLRENRTLRLAGLSALAWDILLHEGPMGADALREAIVAQIGDSPQADESTREDLARLHEVGAVRSR